MDIDKLILKFIWRGERPRMANIIMKETIKVELLLPESKTYYSNQESVVLEKE